MKKAHLFMLFLALSATLYGICEVYAGVYHSTMTTNSSQQFTRSTNDYNTPTSQPNLRIYGDPITDPRPKSIRPPIPL